MRSKINITNPASMMTISAKFGVLKFSPLLCYEWQSQMHHDNPIYLLSVETHTATFSVMKKASSLYRFNSKGAHFKLGIRWKKIKIHIGMCNHTGYHRDSSLHIWYIRVGRLQRTPLADALCSLEAILVPRTPGMTLPTVCWLSLELIMLSSTASSPLHIQAHNSCRSPLALSEAMPLPGTPEAMTFPRSPELQRQCWSSNLRGQSGCQKHSGDTKLDLRTHQSPEPQATHARRPGIKQKLRGKQSIQQR